MFMPLLLDHIMLPQNRMFAMQTAQNAHVVLDLYQISIDLCICE